MIPASAMAGHVERRVARLKKEDSVEALRGRPLYARLALDSAPALAPGARVVEIRFTDLEGKLLVPRENATAEEAARRAREARDQGAVAVAIWVERNFHAGDYSHLEAARAACPDLFLIARDVVVDAWQLDRCRAAGADAIELIPELLGPVVASVAAAVRNLGLVPVTIGPDLAIRSA